VTAASIIIALTLVGAGGTAVVAVGAPERQAVTLSVFGLLLTLLFFVLRAPDVALSQLAVGTAVVPLMVMLAIRTIRIAGGRRAGGGGTGEQHGPDEAEHGERNGPRGRQGRAGR
jgi:energy-converting hydrogenase B subunit D